MAVTRSVVFVIVACVCFAIALLASLAALHANYDVFIAGGLLSLALSFLP